VSVHVLVDVPEERVEIAVARFKEIALILGKNRVLWPGTCRGSPHAKYDESLLRECAVVSSSGTFTRTCT